MAILGSKKSTATPKTKKVLTPDPAASIMKFQQVKASSDMTKTDYFRVAAVQAATFYLCGNSSDDCSPCKGFTNKKKPSIFQVADHIFEYLVNSSNADRASK